MCPRFVSYLFNLLLALDAIHAYYIPLNYVPELGYTIDIAVGHPPQKLTVRLDLINEGLQLFHNVSIKSNTFLFKPELSMAFYLCTLDKVCTSNAPYSCRDRSNNLENAQYFTYEMYPSLLTMNVIPKTHLVCRSSAEAEDKLSLSVTALSNTQKIFSIPAPLKLVRGLGSCSTLNLSFSNEVMSHKIAGTWGILGQSCREPSVLDLINMVSSINYLSLDLNGMTAMSKLHFHGNANFSNVVWSESLEPGMQKLYGLPFMTIYNTAMCEVQLGGKISNVAGVLLDLNSPCLGLPMYLWKALMSWLPVICNDEDEILKHPNNVYRCLVNSTALGDSKLPYLSLSLVPDISIDTDRQPQVLHISLQDLVLPNGQLCVDLNMKLNDLLFSSVKNYEYSMLSPFLKNPKQQLVASVINPVITFGFKVLEQFEFYYNLQEKRVGLQAKKAKVTHVEFCNPTKNCIGWQLYHPSTNVCEDPTCSEWYLKTLNPITKCCEYSQSVMIGIVILFLFLIVWEFCIVFQRIRQENMTKLKAS